MISRRSPRRAAWIQVFGSDSVPILSPVPVRNQGPDGCREFYRLDVARLTADQRQRLVRFLSQRWKLPPNEVEKDIDDPQHGVPIRADDVVVAVDLRLFA